MDSPLKKPKNEKLVVVALFFLLYLITFGQMIFPRFSPEALDRYINHEQSNPLVYGRIAAYLINLLFSGMDVYEMFFFGSFLSVLCLTVSSVIIYSKVSQALEKKSLITAGAIAILFCNTFMVDVFYFSDLSHTMTLGILFSSLALLPIRKDMQVEDFLDSMTLMIIAMNFYQSSLGYYVALSLILIYFLYGGNFTRTAMRDNVVVLSAAAAAVIICLMEVKLLQITGMTYRNNQAWNFNLATVIKNLRELYKIIPGTILIRGNYIYPRYLLPAFLAIVYVALLYVVTKKRVPLRNCFYLIAVILIGRFSIYLPHLLTSVLMATSRSLLSFWSILSIPLLLIEYYRENRLKKSVLSVIVLILCVNVIYSEILEANIFVAR